MRLRQLVSKFSLAGLITALACSWTALAFEQKPEADQNATDSKKHPISAAFQLRVNRTATVSLRGCKGIRSSG